MRLKVNGEEKQVNDIATVADLLARIGLPKEGVAVAVNMEVVSKSEHATHRLEDGDQVEVIRAVGGGRFSFRPETRVHALGT